MNFIDHKYILLLSSQLEGFTRVGSNFNFRCNLCGDSTKNKRKKRGWILESDKHPRFYCHNCGASLPFSKYLKEVNPVLYKEYIYDILKEKNVAVEAKPEMITPLDTVKKMVWKEAFLKVCTSVDELTDAHPVNIYLDSRSIPKDKRSNLYFIENMQSLYALDKDNRYTGRIFETDGRLVMPMWSKTGLIGVSCRSIEENPKKRYVIYKFDEKKPMIFNLYDVNGDLMIDRTKPVYIFEGALDSLFLDNAIAVNGSDLMRTLKMFKDLELIFVPDNEPRNKDIVRVFKKVIDANNQVVIFPDTVDEKDINNMVLKFGHEEIVDVINNNIYHGVTAQLHLNLWKRV